MLSYPILFAWSWAGHGQMTVGAIVIAIARLIPLGKAAVMQRLNEFGALRVGADKGTFGSTPSKQAGERIEAVVRGVERHSLSTVQQNLIHSFEDLPSIVQEQDLHLGNAPVIGEYVGYIPIIGVGQQNAQVRHFMRSHESISARDAFLASRAYIWNNLCDAWFYMRRRVYDKSHWCDFFYNSAVSDFYKGVDFLGVASTRLRIRMPPGRQEELGIGSDRGHPLLG